MNSEFEKIWARIKAETNLKTLQQLANIIKISQPAVSEMKAKGKFPPGWAYLVGREFGLLTEWIMTGEGPKMLNEPFTKRKFDILDRVEKWLEELVDKDKEKEIWFYHQFKESFPSFERWEDINRITEKENNSQAYKIA